MAQRREGREPIKIKWGQGWGEKKEGKSVSNYAFFPLRAIAVILYLCREVCRRPSKLQQEFLDAKMLGVAE